MTISLREGVEKYIEWQRDHGAKFHSDAQRLRHFSTTMGDGIDCGAVCKEAIVTYLAGNGTLTRTRSGRYGAVAGFYRYAVSRGYATHSPLPSPDSEPRRPKSPRPYIYSHDELQRMFGAIDGTRQRAIQFDGDTFRTLLVVLYGTGLRVGEALKLEIRDVDLLQSVLTIRDAKFYRSRLVPVGPQLSHILRNYAAQRAGRPMSKGEESTFLANLDGSAVPYMTVMNAFKNLLRAAGIRNSSPQIQSPRLHGLRHTFAVHRVTSWYREGAEVQKLLPVLSTYMGHVKLEGTLVYLSMTPELLQEASQRFERYVFGEHVESGIDGGHHE